MRTAMIAAITKKDLLAVSRSRGVLIPMIIVPIVMLVALPGILATAVRYAAEEFPLDDLGRFLANMPAGMMTELEGLSDTQTVLYLMLGYMFAPMFLVLPLMVASIIAADSFAGEKERGTLEALLYTPATDEEIFVGKVLAGWVPAVLVGVLGGLLYSAVADIAAWPVMGRAFLPNATWLLLMLWVAPAIAGLGLGFTVMVSARVKSLQEAFQLSGVLVLPVVLLVVGQLGGVVYLSPIVVFGLGLLLWLAVVVVLRLGSRAFRRTEVLAKRA